MAEFVVDKFPIDSERVAIEAARFCFSSTSELVLARPEAHFVRSLDASGQMEPMVDRGNHWIVCFDVEREGELASTAIIRICIDCSTGVVSHILWDNSKHTISVVRSR